MLDVGQQAALRHAIASQLVRNDHPRSILQAFQQTLEEPLGSIPITALLNENIKDNTVLIHSAPKIALSTLDPNEHFIEVPFVARLGSKAAQTASKALAEFLTPASHCLVGDYDATFCQDQLNIPQAEAERMIEPYRMADNIRRKPMTVMGVG